MAPRTRNRPSPASPPPYRSRNEQMWWWRKRAGLRPPSRLLRGGLTLACLLLDAAVVAFGLELLSGGTVAVGPHLASGAFAPPLGGAGDVLNLAAGGAMVLAWAAGNVGVAAHLFAGRRPRWLAAVGRAVERLVWAATGLLLAALVVGVLTTTGFLARLFDVRLRECWTLAALAVFAALGVARAVGRLGAFGLSAAAVAAVVALGVGWFDRVGLARGAGGAGWWLCWAGLLNLAVVAHVGLRRLVHDHGEAGSSIR